MHGLPPHAYQSITSNACICSVCVCVCARMHVSVCVCKCVSVCVCVCDEMSVLYPCVFVRALGS